MDFLFFRFTLPLAVGLNIFPVAFDADFVRSLLIACGGAGAAYSGWKLRALAIEKANADALQRRVEVLEGELLAERDARIGAEKDILVHQGELAALRARPNYDTIQALVVEQAAAALERQTQVAQMMKALGEGQERIVAALTDSFERRDSAARTLPPAGGATL